MVSLPRSRWFLLAGLAVALLCRPGFAAPGDEKKDVEFKRVPLPTCDGMELQGTFYPAGAGKSKDACVLLLHNFDSRKGGGSHQDGWDALAARLQKEGYDVLSFDFRGFGDSKSVSPKFWKYPYGYNQMLLRGAARAKPPESIDQKDFPVNYYPYLINDIAAARAFLDRKNDAQEVNSSNLIVIGAGEGATLGALWMASECRRKKNKAPPGIGVLPQLDEPESKDFACAIWLSISPTLAGRKMPIQPAVVEVAREAKVPTVLIYGKNDTAADNISNTLYKAMTTGPGGKSVDLKDTGRKGVAGTELSGSKLLQDRDRLGTAAFISTHLAKVLDNRGTRERKKREIDKYIYVWAMPRGRPILCKRAGEDLPGPVPLQMLGIQP